MNKFRVWMFVLCWLWVGVSVQFGSEAFCPNHPHADFSAAAGAQNGLVPSEGCRKELKVDEFFIPEDALLAKNTFEKFRGALLKGNREQVVALLRFPTYVSINGYPRTFDTPREFMSSYDKVFTGYVIDSVRKQKLEELLGGWDGVKLSNHAVTFARDEDGEFRVGYVTSKRVRLPDSIAVFLDQRLTCPPIVIEGRIVAYNWVSHTFPGGEGIYADHFIVEVTGVVSGKVDQRRIRVDFWGVSNMPEYNLPPKAFEAGTAWRMYLRPADSPPSNEGVCGKDVQETISNVDEAGHVLSKDSAIAVIAGDDSPTYVGLPCFEVHKQFFSTTNSQVSRRYLGATFAEEDAEEVALRTKNVPQGLKRVLKKWLFWGAMRMSGVARLCFLGCGLE